MKVYLETMGCQMNKLDSELVLHRLRAGGHEIVEEAAAADAVLYNTCSVRRHAEEKVFSRLGEQCKRKRRGGGRPIVGVLGCMAQRLAGELLDTFPGIDIICGPSEIDRLADLLENAAAARQLAVAPPRPQRPRELDDKARQRLEEFDLSRPAASASGAQAFVRVQRGCDNFCTYCIVPYVRGSEQSRDPAAVRQEVERLAEGGVKEITLLGQAVNHYAWADGGRSANLADLLALLDPIAGIERIRFVTNYPGNFNRAILSAMADLPKVCPYLHVPAQSGSDRILRAMNRRYTVAEYLDLLAAARAVVPHLVVAGDFIVGFPGEMEEDFQASCDLVRRAAYKNSFIFRYSPRDGTIAAAKLPDDVPAAEKARRNAQLLAVQNEVSLAHHQSLVGTLQQVLVEGPSIRASKQPRTAAPGTVQMTGRTRGDHIVVFDAPPSWVGTFVNVQITGATALALMGKPQAGDC
jgi:tRNA-2-methylthio-N6-dimethylallyladenosine synthase